MLSLQSCGSIERSLMHMDAKLLYLLDCKSTSQPLTYILYFHFSVIIRRISRHLLYYICTGIPIMHLLSPCVFISSHQ